MLGLRLLDFVDTFFDFARAGTELVSDVGELRDRPQHLAGAGGHLDHRTADFGKRAGKLVDLPLKTIPSGKIRRLVALHGFGKMDVIHVRVTDSERINSFLGESAEIRDRHSRRAHHVSSDAVVSLSVASKPAKPGGSSVVKVVVNRGLQKHNPSGH
ncbi:MAG: hypothetical protein MI724_00190 [Spirochaetales bacterium]|nr:hypothetical protein [Spirochaetales bacterium]